MPRDKVKYAAQQHRYYLANKTKINARQRLYRLKHKAQRAAQQHRYHMKHKTKRATNCRRSRLRFKTNPVMHEEDYRVLACLRDSGQRMSRLRIYLDLPDEIEIFRLGQILRRLVYFGLIDKPHYKCYLINPLGTSVCGCWERRGGVQIALTGRPIESDAVPRKANPPAEG